MAEQDFSDENDDWETLDETGELDKQITALDTKVKQSTPSEHKNSSTLQYGKVTILQNNEQRTQYSPTIKLLKRDPLDAASSQQGVEERKSNYKTLQQREAEYNEARKRILGDVPEINCSQSMEEQPTPSPVLVQRSSIGTNKKLDPVLQRQPYGPETNSKGFGTRATGPINSTS